MSRHLALAALILIPSPSMADGKTVFKLRPIAGRVILKNDHKIEVRSQKVIEETITNITLTDETKFRKGSTEIRERDLKEGDSVSVIGTKLPTGELIAREIVIGSHDEDSNR